ncbi:MAG: malate dehydrogenase [Gammaproteobacteria bacterium]
MKKQIITITGAAGNIAYSLIFRILAGNIFDQDTKIQLNLLDISQALPILMGVKLEIEDCAFRQLDSVIITDKPEEAFADSDYILLVGAKPRSKGMQRADLLLDNANIFKAQGNIINENAKTTTKIIVVGNPANTNALIIEENTKNIPTENISSLMRLDQNRAKSILSVKTDCRVEQISQLIVWGNHSATQYPDINNALINNSNEKILSLNDQWVSDEFIPRVQNRGAEIIEHRGKSSAASAASAIYDHIYALVNGSSDWESMGIMSSNPYDIDDQIFFSYPLNIVNDEIKIIETVDLSETSIKYIKNTEKELISERDVIKDLL